MKKKQLEELVRGIVREMLKEYDASMSVSDMRKLADSDPSLNGSTPPNDAMTSAEKSRIARQQKDDTNREIKQKEIELDAAKKKMSFQNKDRDQLKRFTIPNLTKDLQALKGAQI